MNEDLAHCLRTFSRLLEHSLLGPDDRLLEAESLPGEPRPSKTAELARLLQHVLLAEPESVLPALPERPGASSLLAALLRCHLDRQGLPAGRIMAVQVEPCPGVMPGLAVDHLEPGATLVAGAGADPLELFPLVRGQLLSRGARVLVGCRAQQLLLGLDAGEARATRCQPASVDGTTSLFAAVRPEDLHFVDRLASRPWQPLGPDLVPLDLPAQPLPERNHQWSDREPGAEESSLFLAESDEATLQRRFDRRFLKVPVTWFLGPAASDGPLPSGPHWYALPWPEEPELAAERLQNALLMNTLLYTDRCFGQIDGTNPVVEAGTLSIPRHPGIPGRQGLRILRVWDDRGLIPVDYHDVRHAPDTVEHLYRVQAMSGDSLSARLRFSADAPVEHLKAAFFQYPVSPREPTGTQALTLRHPKRLFSAARLVSDELAAGWWTGYDDTELLDTFAAGLTSRERIVSIRDLEQAIKSWHRFGLGTHASVEGTSIEYGTARVLDPKGRQSVVSDVRVTVLVGPRGAMSTLDRGDAARLLAEHLSERCCLGHQVSVRLLDGGELLTGRGGAGGRP